MNTLGHNLRLETLRHLHDLSEYLPGQLSHIPGMKKKVKARRTGTQLDLADELTALTVHLNYEDSSPVFVLLQKLLAAINCEMVEMIPSPCETDLPPLSAAHKVHTKEYSPTPWSEDETTPVGLCATSRNVVFIECSHTDQRFNLPYDINRISQLVVGHSSI